MTLLEKSDREIQEFFGVPPYARATVPPSGALHVEVGARAADPFALALAWATLEGRRL